MNSFKNSIGMDLVLLPPGKFRMGLPTKPFPELVHNVILSQFWIGQYEVTNDQFECFRKRPRPMESRRGDEPVTRIRYEDATEFCAWLSRVEKRPYRLQTEAEWEYAARGGLDQKLYPWGDTADWTGRANFGSTTTTPVGSYAPNGYGLYDMAGNVCEYVSDFYDEHYYKHSPLKDPQGPSTPVKPSTTSDHVIRGGFFGLYRGYCGLRDIWDDTAVPVDYSKFTDEEQADGLGFRIAMTDTS